MTSDLAGRLLAWEPLGRLRLLNLMGEPLESDRLRPLAGSALLANLRALALGYPPFMMDSRIQIRGIQTLMASPHPLQLRELQLRTVRMSEDGVRAIARSQHTSRLSKLVLHNNGLEPSHLEDLFASDALRQVRYLSLRGNRIGDAGARHLAGCRALAGLRFLDLSYNRIGPEGIQALARSPYLNSLTGLDLAGNGEAGSAGFNELLTAPFLPQLRSLNLSALKLPMGSLKAIAACPALTNLRHLALNFNGELDEQEVVALAESPYLNNLLSLELIHGRLGLVGLKALYQSPRVNNLLALALSDRMTGIPEADDLFFSSRLREQLVRLSFFTGQSSQVPDRYREVLGDRLVLAR
jgi:hypothetical protein